MLRGCAKFVAVAVGIGAVAFGFGAVAVLIAFAVRAVGLEQSTSLLGVGAVHLELSALSFHGCSCRGCGSCRPWRSLYCC